MGRNEFIKVVAPFAMEDHKRTGVLASITIAQAILESDSGKSAPANNLFGIKGRGTIQKTKEFINGEWITVRAGFRAYESYEGSVKDHGDFLVENKRYAKAGFFTACKTGDYMGAAKALQRAGYATDPQYAASLIKLIQSHELFQYDKGGYCMGVEDANKLIAILAGIYNGIAEAQEEVHRLANELRKSSGQEVTD